jgi:hypothetical protein
MEEIKYSCEQDYVKRLGSNVSLVKLIENIKEPIRSGVEVEK